MGKLLKLLRFWRWPSSIFVSILVLLAVTILATILAWAGHLTQPVAIMLGALVLPVTAGVGARYSRIVDRRSKMIEERIEAFKNLINVVNDPGSENWQVNQALDTAYLLSNHRVRMRVYRFRRERKQDPNKLAQDMMSGKKEYYEALHDMMLEVNSGVEFGSRRGRKPLGDES